MSYLFSPQATTTQAATTSASTAKAIPGGARKGKFQVRVYNDGTTLGYIKFGDSSVAATASDIPIPAGLPVGFTIQGNDRDGQVYFSVIMASGSATFSVTSGDGI
jgi:hypothetical protein